MQQIVYSAKNRGFMDHGWLQAYHSFSFGGYYDSSRMSFGVLRVLNDDTIAPSRGFETHSHSNMEIITIPLEGNVTHRDDLGNESVLSSREIQVISAGRGIEHSEYNRSSEDKLNLLQIWIDPNRRDVDPRYESINISNIAKKNQFYQIVSPDKDDQGAWIHQKAWLSLAEADAKQNLSYNFKSPKNGVYIFLIQGEVIIGRKRMKARDAMSITITSKINIQTLKESKILVIDVPLGNQLK